MDAQEPLRLSGDVFDEVWPRVALAVLRSLLRRGVGAATAEDVTQEVAVRALGREFESEGHVRRWCTRVAFNLAIDGSRRDGRIDLGEVPEVEGRCAAEDAIARVELSRVAAAISALSVSDQQVLRMAASGAGVAGAKRERDRFALQLFRARKRLLDALKVWLGLGAITGAWRRRGTVVLAAVAAVTGASWSSLIHGGEVPMSAPPREAVEVRAAATASNLTSGGIRTQSIAAVHTLGTTSDEVRRPAPSQRLARLDVPSPSGSPLVRVDAEDHGNEPRPLICIRNLPVAGSYCSVAPPSG